MKKKEKFFKSSSVEETEKARHKLCHSVKSCKQAHRFSFTPSGAVKSFYMTSFRPPAAALVSTQQPQIPQ